jgi:hypothetical protein
VTRLTQSNSAAAASAKRDETANNNEEQKQNSAAAVQEKPAAVLVRQQVVEPGKRLAVFRKPVDAEAALKLVPELPAEAINLSVSSFLFTSSQTPERLVFNLNKKKKCHCSKNIYEHVGE